MARHNSFYSVLLIVLLAMISITGCGDSKETNGQITKKIGIIQIVEHPSLNSIRESFIKQLAANGFKEGSNLTVDYQNAQGDPNNLKLIAQKFKNAKYDLIVAIATPSAQAIAGETKDIPIVFAAVTDPVSAGLVQDLQKPGGNITGTSDVTSAEQNIKLAMQITPDIHKLGAIYNPGDTAAVMVMNELRQYLKSSNEKIELVEMTASSTGDVQQVMQSLAGKVDAIFAPPDNTIASSMPVVSKVARDAKKPLYVGADSMVKDGALAGYGIDYDILGQKTADMATEVLNGKKPGDIPVKVMTELNIYVNTDTAKAIGVSLPDDVLNKAKENFGK
ncbi:protein of unknown function DUF534 [Paenibacillus curdlanolyticus YK9]|uniref:ABC transporter substrate binding protein n=1 Tax=Paenibacillus curdlanolyticus YK9 TaxID=717606 RepID=E0I5Y1_9BACL|nr:ABC transporter substrate-binding protein [Paenibacillus curdlanolyticus]EFM12373.1 protein of unknown function DUF534 [Paenibacillus curdlanolyticus YK9]